MKQSESKLCYETVLMVHTFMCSSMHYLTNAATYHTKSSSGYSLSVFVCLEVVCFSWNYKGFYFHSKILSMTCRMGIWSITRTPPCRTYKNIDIHCCTNRIWTRDSIFIQVQDCSAENGNTKHNCTYYSSFSQFHSIQVITFSYIY